MSYERVLTGRPGRSTGVPWDAKGRTSGRLLPAGTTEPEAQAPDPAAVEAQIEAVRQAAAAQGYAAGREQAERELAAGIAAASALAHSLETAVPRDVDMVSRTVAELAVLVTRRIIGAELRHDPAVLVNAISAGLRQAMGASTVHVELSPSAVDVVEAAWTARHGSRHLGIVWSFAADPTLPVGGCRLRTEHGIVEAGFEAQLSEIAAALDAAIPGYLVSALGPTSEAAGGGTAPAVAGELRAAVDLASLDNNGDAPQAGLDDLDLAGLDLAGLDLEGLGLAGLDLSGGAA